MLLVELFFKTFVRKSIADASMTAEVLVCISCDGRAQVDEMVDKAIAAGGKSPNALQDHGNRYVHGFEDLVGHPGEVMWMDPNAAPPQA